MSELTDVIPTPNVPEAPLLLERFTITLPSGERLAASLHRSPHRRSGRRIQVREQGGSVIFDSDDCYDFGNAKASLDDWLGGLIGPHERSTP